MSMWCSPPIQAPASLSWTIQWGFQNITMNIYIEYIKKKITPDRSLEHCLVFHYTRFTWESPTLAPGPGWLPGHSEVTTNRIAPSNIKYTTQSQNTPPNLVWKWLQICTFDCWCNISGSLTACHLRSGTTTRIQQILTNRDQSNELHPLHCLKSMDFSPMVYILTIDKWSTNSVQCTSTHANRVNIFCQTLLTQ